MRRIYQQLGTTLLASAGLLNVQCVHAGENDDKDSHQIAEIVVTSHRREQPVQSEMSNISQVDSVVIRRVQQQHIHELLTRIPGAWISRGSGQEHLTAIRSPVLTGAGSCGGFLFLEDSIPIRPAGFCNVNQLFEVNTEQAQRIEVIRGPGNALFGSNALHGVMNVVMPTPGQRAAPLLGLEVGSNDFIRVRAELPFNSAAPYLASIVYADDGGFRDESGYQQGKIHLKRSWVREGEEFTAALTATELRQETAGFITGENAYKDPELNRSNPNPEAFRNANSLRLYAIWTRETDKFDLDIRPYLRHSEMEFLQHFLPGQPLEENGQVSAGLLTAATFDRAAHQTTVGLDVEWSDVFLQETQFGAAEGPDFIEETRPEGKHYDFEAIGASVAAFVQTEILATEKLTVGTGIRVEYIHYDYENRMLDGNTRDDGTACGFGGCLYTRPADRTDSFTNLAPNLAINYRSSSATTLFANLTRGFRAPQMTELYRLQNGQEVADLGSENVISLEIGLRTNHNTWTAELAAFAMRKDDSVFRDADGYNVSGGASRHQGLEVDLDWQLQTNWMLAVDATIAQHTYDFNKIAARGETFVAGRDVDTSPRWLASIELTYDAGNILSLSMQWTGIAKYYLDAENQYTYPGHNLLNLRAGFRLTPQFNLILRANNILDTDIADRADYAFGSYRYFPGRGREFFAELRFTPMQSR
jgi:iron complex outermembrane receptor protein